MSWKMRILIGFSALAAVGLIGAAGYYGFASKQPDPSDLVEKPPTVAVTRSDVDLTVTAPGTLAEASTQTIRSEVEGKLAAINVKAGDLVHAGDIIATLDAEALQDALDKAQQAVEDAEDQLASGVSKAQTALRDAQDKLAQAQLDVPTRERAEAALNHAQVGLSDAQTAALRAQDQADEAKADLNDAQDDLDDANNALDKVANTRKNAKRALDRATNQQNAAQNTLDQATANQAAAQMMYDEAVDDQAAAQQAYDESVANGEPQSVIDERQAALDAANAALATAQTNLDAAKAAVTSAQSNLDAAKAEAASAQQDYTAAEADFQAKLAERDQTEGKVDQADNAYDQAQSQADQQAAQVHQAEYAVQQAQLDLDEFQTKKKLSDLQITSARRAVTDAEEDLADAQGRTVDPDLLDAVQKAQEALGSAVIRAETDGQITNVLADAGTRVTADQEIVELTNPDLLEASTTVVEEDLPLVKVGQEVSLFFDAAPDADLTGTVDRILPERQEGSDRPLYIVTITINGKLPEGLRPGMTVEGSIIIESRKDVLSLPRAVVQAHSDGTAKVDVWTGSGTEERTVKVGLRGDTLVEIIEGLAEGEEVVAQ